MLIIQRITHCKGILESIDQTLRVSTPKKSLSDSLPPLKKNRLEISISFLQMLFKSHYGGYPNKWLMINLRIIFEDFQVGIIVNMLF